MLLLLFKNIFDFNKEINAKIFIASDFGFNPRALWKLGDLGIIDLQVGRKWEKFSIVDVFWLKLVNVLQSFGLPAPVIVAVKNEIKKKFSYATNDGMFNLFSHLVARDEIKIKITNNDKNDFEVEISDAQLKYSMAPQNEFSMLQPVLTVPLLSITREIIKCPVKKNRDNYIIRLIKFGLLSTPEAELLMNIEKGVKKIEVDYEGTTEVVENISVDDYLTILLHKKYSNIAYLNISEQVVKFNSNDKHNFIFKTDD